MKNKSISKEYKFTFELQNGTTYIETVEVEFEDGIIDNDIINEAYYAWATCLNIGSWEEL